MANQLMPTNQNISHVVHEIGDLLATARSNVARQMNNELLSTYWNIGRIIAEYEQTVPERADYGKQTLKELSKALTNEFGKGFSVSDIQFMRRFYQTYQIQQAASVKAIPHNSARAYPEKIWVLIKALFRRCTLCTSRKSDEIRAQIFQEMPKADCAVLP